MAKEFKKWIDEFVENGANPADVTNWPEEARGGSIEVFKWIQNVTEMTDEIMEKLTEGKMILKQGSIFYFYAAQGEESAGDSSYRYYKFSSIPLRNEETGIVCWFDQIEFRKYSNEVKYRSNSYVTEMKQPAPMVKIWSGTLSSDNKIHYILDDDMKKSWMQSLYDGAILNIDIDWISGYNNKILYQTYATSGLLKYVSAMDGTVYGLYTIEFTKVNDDIYEMTISREVYDIADHVEVKYPVLPGVGTQYTLTVGGKAGLTMQEAASILRANILAIGQFSVLSMFAGADETSATFTTPVYNNSYYSIVLTPVGGRELTAIDVNITENAVGGRDLLEPTFNFEVSSLSTSSSGELSADNPIVQWLLALAEKGVKTASAKVNIYETSENGGINDYILLTLARAYISSRGEVVFSTIIGGDGVYSYTLSITPYMASQWYYDFKVSTIVNPEPK